MKPSPPVTEFRRGRQPRKRGELAAELRTRITSGKLLPGARLPSRRDICTSSGASLATVQQALNRLAEEGFVEARGPKGTFVAGTPPHLAHYALLIPGVPNSEGRGFLRYWTALAQEAAAETQRGARHVEVFYGVDMPDDGRPYRRLVRLVEDRRLAGLIFPVAPGQFVNTPLMTVPGIGRAAITGTQPCTLEISQVELDFTALLRRALECLVADKRKRMALFHVYGDPRLKRWLSEANRLGIDVRPHWVHGIEPSTPGTARNIARLLMHAKGSERPDALVVSDDNLVEHALGGLLEEGVRIGDDITVVGHCNFPWPAPSVVSMTRLGYDARRVLAACIECVDATRKRNAPLRHIKIEPVFEHELEDLGSP